MLHSRVLLVLNYIPRLVPDSNKSWKNFQLNLISVESKRETRFIMNKVEEGGQQRSEAGFDVTSKSLSEALLFAEHGENMLFTKIVLKTECQKQFLYTTCSPQV